MGVKEDKAVLADYDPWDVPEFKVNEISWSELTTAGKVKRVCWEYIGKFIILLGLLYLFICSLDFLSTAFRLLGGKAAGRVFAENELLTNPVAGLMIGVLVTVLVQSSSTSTSIVITMVGAEVIPPGEAVFIIMGANIGTTVTNTIVSLAQAGDRDEFRRAFGGATVHDMFNWLCVAIFLPLEAATGFLFKMTEKMVEQFKPKPNEEADQELLKKITKPFTSLVIQIDKKVITKIATGDKEAVNKNLLKKYCDDKDSILGYETQLKNVTTATGAIELRNVTDMDSPIYDKKVCEALFSQFSLTDTEAGIIILVIALFILCVCLVLIVKLLHSMLKGRIAAIIKSFINADFPGCFKHLTGYIAILLGGALTILVQSSSIFTSAMTPLVGVGVIHIDRFFPLTLGSNIGTTVTGILAALTQDKHFDWAFQIAMVHLFFNIFGILVWYPIPFMRKIPIGLAKRLGNITADYRWFAILYLFLIFFIIPAAVFGLSLAGWYVLLGVGLPILILFIAVIIINILQEKRPSWICCSWLRNWDFLPLWMHSLEPLDRILRRICFCACCQRTFCDKGSNLDEDKAIAMENGNGHMTSNGVNNPAYHTNENTFNNNSMKQQDADQQGTKF